MKRRCVKFRICRPSNPSIWPNSSSIWVCKYRQQGVFSLCVCVWERLTRCGNRSYPSTGKTLGTTWVLGEREGDRPREGGWGLSGKRGNERRKPSTFHSHNKTPPSAPSSLSSSSPNKCEVSLLNNKCTAAWHNNKLCVTNESRQTFLPVCIFMLTTYSRHPTPDLRLCFGTESLSAEG